MDLRSVDHGGSEEGKWAKLTRMAQVRGISPNALKAAVVIAAVILVVTVARCVPFESGGSFSIDSSAVTEVTEEIDSESDSDDQTAVASEIVTVHVTGAVALPGVYSLSEGDRVLDAVEEAGGFAEGASQASVNLARVLSDGEQVHIPTQEEVDSGQYQTSDSSGSSGSSLININTATADELDTLPGIGPATAANIISYREENGGFDSIEEIKEVSGIGDAKYAQIADLICV